MLTEFKASTVLFALASQAWIQGNSVSSGLARTLRACDFHLAKRELQTFFHYAAEQAVARQGEGGIYRVEFVRGWEVFAERPCYDTAVAFIEGAPDYADLIWAYFWAYLIECCPGGMLLKDDHRRLENEFNDEKSRKANHFPTPQDYILTTHKYKNL